MINKLWAELPENTRCKYTSIHEGTEKKMYIEGIFLQSNIINRNNRYYPNEVMDEAVGNYSKNFVISYENGNAWGEVNHPNPPRSTIDISKVSHRIVELTRDGDNWIGKAIIINKNPSGKLIEGLLLGGGMIGVSSRSTGVLNKRSDGVYEVTKCCIHTAADIVTDPSAPDAYVQSLYEGIEWINELSKCDKDISEVLDEGRDNIMRASTKQLDYMKSLEFKRILDISINRIRK